MMQLKSTHRVKILEYKFIFEENIQVNKEFLEGATDLNYRLSFFRNKLHNLNESKNKKQKFDSIFMGNINDDNYDLSTEEHDKLTKSAARADSIEDWAKKLYRNIVMTTHPDKTVSIPSLNLREQLTEQYRITQNAYNHKVYSDLIMVGFDLNLDIPADVIDTNINSATETKKNEIIEIKKKIGWQWYHVPEDQKDAELKKILLYYGFKFTEEKIKDVVKRPRIKRKVGTRPEKINVKRKKIK